MYIFPKKKGIYTKYHSPQHILFLNIYLMFPNILNKGSFQNLIYYFIIYSLSSKTLNSVLFILLWMILNKIFNISTKDNFILCKRKKYRHFWWRQLLSSNLLFVIIIFDDWYYLWNILLYKLDFLFYLINMQEINYRQKDITQKIIKEYLNKNYQNDEFTLHISKIK